MFNRFLSLLLASAVAGVGILALGASARGGSNDDAPATDGSPAEPGDDNGGLLDRDQRFEPGDDRDINGSATTASPATEPGDDHGGHGSRDDRVEPGDDRDNSGHGGSDGGDSSSGRHG